MNKKKTVLVHLSVSLFNQIESAASNSVFCA